MLTILRCVFVYFMIGFSFNLVTSLVYKKFDPLSFIYMIGDTGGDNDYILMNILLWPLFTVLIIYSSIPFLIKKMYVLFVAIIFGIVALIKKGGEQ